MIEKRLITRRRMLGLMAGAGVSGVACSTLNPMRDAVVSMPSGSRIVVVGAGACGLAASRKLREAGYRVELIEARNRIGGRAWTTGVGSIPFDQGASWLHDGQSNYLRATAEAGGFDLYATDMNRGVILYGGETVPINAGEAMAGVEDRLTGYYLRRRMQEALGIHRPLPSLKPLTDWIEQTYGAQGAYLVELITASDACPPGDSTLYSLTADAGLPEDDGWNPLPSDEALVGGGMQPFVTQLGGEAGETLNEPVQAILRHEKGVAVKTPRRSIEAAGVIVTVPLGVLKSGSIRFEPGMPAEHQAALDRLGFGTEKKTCLIYPEGPWPTEHHLIGLPDSPLFNFMVNVKAVAGHPMIMALTAGDKLAAADALTREELGEALHGHVLRTLGRALPDPLDVATTDWGNDPYALGAYSYTAFGCRGNEREILRRPIHGRILLAGEGISDRYGFIDGAWNDGERAAREMMES